MDPTAKDALTISRLLAVLALVMPLACSTDRSDRNSGTSADSLAQAFGRRFVAFLQAADRGDSIALASATSDSIPIKWLQRVNRQEPGFVQALLENRTMEAFDRIAPDTVAMLFTFRHRDDTERIGVTFVQQAGAWKVWRVGLPNRM
jgi:hypothetical protein